MRLRPLGLLLLPLLVLLMAAGAHATTVLRLSAEQVDALAKRIVEGRCVETREARVGLQQLSVTEYVFAVECVVKGDGLAEELRQSGGLLIVRQVGGPKATGSFTIVGLPAYEPGKRYRLALNGESTLGLTSPVGMGQGVRLLTTDPPSATRAQP